VRFSASRGGSSSVWKDSLGEGKGPCEVASPLSSFFRLRVAKILKEAASRRQFLPPGRAEARTYADGQKYGQNPGHQDRILVNVKPVLVSFGSPLPHFLALLEFKTGGLRVRKMNPLARSQILGCPGIDTNKSIGIFRGFIKSLNTLGTMQERI